MATTSAAGGEILTRGNAFGLLPRLELGLHASFAAHARGRLSGVWKDRDGRECGRSWVDGTYRWLEWLDVGLFGFDQEPSMVRAWPKAGVGDDTVRQIFAKDIEPILLQAMGYEVLHASAVASPAGVTAFCGLSGSGKSTLAFAMSRRGRAQVADDHLVLEVADGRVNVCPRPFDASIRPASAEHFGIGSTHSVTTQISRDLELAALMLIEQAPALDREVSITPVAPAAAFAAILPHAHCFDPGDADETGRVTRHYLSIVEAVPVYRVRYRPSFESLPLLLDAIEALVPSAAGQVS